MNCYKLVKYIPDTYELDPNVESQEFETWEEATKFLRGKAGRGWRIQYTDEYASTLDTYREDDTFE